MSRNLIPLYEKCDSATDVHVRPVIAVTSLRSGVPLTDRATVEFKPG